MSMMMMMMWPCSRSWIRRRRYVQSTIYEAIVYDRWTVNAITTRPVLSAERPSFSAAIFIFFCLCFIYLRPDDTRMPWLCDEKAQVIAPASSGETICPPPMAVRLVADLRPSADGSAVRTSLVAGQLQAASVLIAYRQLRHAASVL